MNHLAHLRQEIAKMRLKDLVEEYGKEAGQVKSYRRRMGKMIEGDVEVDPQPVTKKLEINQDRTHRWAGNY